MANYLVTDTELTSIADAIRTKGGTSESLEFPTDFVSAIENIPSGGGGGNYEITVSLTNPISSSDFDYCNIYEAVNPDFEEAMDGTPLATISTATGSATVSISSASYGIVVSPEGNWGATYADSNVTCTGKIIIAKGSSIFVTARMYLVGSDGTIVLDRIDYGD